MTSKRICILMSAAFAAGCVHSSKSETPALPPQSETEFVKPYYETDFGAATERAPRSLASNGHLAGYKAGPELCGKDQLKFPRVPIDMRPGYCAGLVATAEDGLVAPRTIVQVPKSPHFVVVDFGGWVKNNGRIFLLQRSGNEFKLKLLFSHLDSPHGSGVGPDGKVYVGLATEIFRFDPLAADPTKTVETIVRDLPGLIYAMPDGRTVQESKHPLKSFVFDSNGAIYVSVGAPSDACLTERANDGSCFAGESTRAAAAIWKITPQAGRIFKTLGPSDPNPPMKVFARGLRNSIALVAHPLYPKPGTALLQGENGRDFKDPAQPNEELNSIVEGRHYGYPYCFNDESVSPEYVNYLSSNEYYRGLCVGEAKIPYEKPYSLLPPHAAPLDFKYYNASRFPELKGTLLVTWHGYMPSGSRIAFARVDANGFPIKTKQAIGYNQNCDSRKLIETAESKSVGGVQFEELVTGWYSVGGERPQGSPVGMTIADDGAIWVVDDKNANILRIDATKTPPPAPLACDSRTENEIAELVDFVHADPTKKALLTEVRKNLIEKRCVGCHSDFNLSSEMSEGDRDDAVLHYMLKQDSWVFPGNMTESRIYKRTHALGTDRPMPPNAVELLATNSDHRKVVDELATLIQTMVPGDSYVISTTGALLKLRNEQKTVCGSIPDGSYVLVLDRSPSEMPGFVRVYQPPKKFFNGNCPTGSRYYVGADFVHKP